MKNLLKILVLTLLLVSCKKETENNEDLSKSDFKLTTDLTDFKKKMTESDTIKIWFDHSVCTYQGVERIRITKKSDSIKIRAEFKEETFNDNTDWKTVYEKAIPINDTIWKFEQFLSRNKKRLTYGEKEYGTLQITHGETTLHYFTDGLVDLNQFMADYFETMRELHPENKNEIYGYVFVEE